MRPLTSDDFPLVQIGQFVYRRTESSPIIGPLDPRLAADLALRLNRDDQAFPDHVTDASWQGVRTG